MNILVGANASGKSSTLQSMLLLRQSHAKGFVDQLALSGPLYEAGTAHDILHPRSNYRVEINVNSQNGKSLYSFLVDRDRENGLSARKIPALKRKRLPLELSRGGDDFIYLNAERIGPRTSYDLSGGDTALAGIFGKHGEFAPAVLAKAQLDERKMEGWSSGTGIAWSHVIAKSDNVAVAEELANSGGRIDILANVFLSWIIPGSNFECSELPLQDLATLSYKVGALRSKVRPTHIGFGLSYTLPIIAGALSLSESGIMIVENPEAHLHPYSQSRLGLFLAMMAATGRQIFIETHSDHVVNGIRLGTKLKAISSEDIFFNHFSYDIKEQCSSVQQIEVMPNGRITSWPRGFFDQIESDLSKL